MKQRLTEWLEPVKKGDIDYYERQFQKTYRSTVKFCDWLESLGLLDKNKKCTVVDIGAGLGGNIYYMAKRYPKSFFTGIDVNPLLVRMGNKLFKKLNLKNCKLVKGDLYNLGSEHKGKYEGVVSYQTLSWLPDYKLPVKKMAELKANYVAITSLFYDGDINCKISVQDYTLPIGNKPYREAFYNTYSLKLVKELFRKCGYPRFDYIPFEIDIDLSKPKTKGMGTYTETLKNGKRLQISGPLLMNWYFILARKDLNSYPKPKGSQSLILLHSLIHT